MNLQEQDKSSDIEQQPPFGDRKISNIQPQNRGVQNQQEHHIILTKYEAVHPTAQRAITQIFYTRSKFATKQHAAEISAVKYNAHLNRAAAHKIKIFQTSLFYNNLNYRTPCNIDRSDIRSAFPA